MAKKVGTQNVGNAGEYFIAHVLSAYGFTATITLGRAEKYDILAITPKDKTVKIQVKTSSGTSPYWRMHEKHQKVFDDDFFFAFVLLNSMKKPAEYWIVPSRLVSNFIEDHYTVWMSKPGRKGQKHNPNPGRTFTIKYDKYTPDKYKKVDWENYHNKIDVLL